MKRIDAETNRLVQIHNIPVIQTIHDNSQNYLHCSKMTAQPVTQFKSGLPTDDAIKLASSAGYQTKRKTMTCAAG